MSGKFTADDLVARVEAVCVQYRDVALEKLKGSVTSHPIWHVLGIIVLRYRG